MFLDNLKIHNLRCFVDIEIDFTPEESESTAGYEGRKWTLLAGENGTGKSTVLKALGLLLAGSDALPMLLGDPGSWVRGGADRCRLSARLRTAEGEAREIELVIGSEDGISHVLRNNRDGLVALDDAIQKTERNYFTVGYGPYRRLADERPGSGFESQTSAPLRAQSLATIFDKNAPINPLPAWAMGLEYRKGSEGLDIVRDAMDALLPDMEFEGIDKERGDMMFKTLDGLVPLSDLSDGYQNVAAWIGDLLFRITQAFANYNDPLSARGLLLIDEVDAHLHPTWQRHLRDFLDKKLPNFQIIATSHSALTMHQFHEGEVFTLNRSDDEDRRVVLRAFPGDPSRLRLHQLYDLVFGLDTLDSLDLEQIKDSYRELSAKTERSPEETEKLESIISELEGLPEDRGDALGNEAMEQFFKKADRVVKAMEEKSKQSSETN